MMRRWRRDFKNPDYAYGNEACWRLLVDLAMEFSETIIERAASRMPGLNSRDGVGKGVVHGHDQDIAVARS